MSAGISPSGVASLRARFESKDESTSPPSRGRSPAGSLSVTGDTPHPISKVRTSFISVEPSGQMGDLHAPEELGNKGHVLNCDGAGEFTTNGEVGKPKTNGIDLNPQESTKKEGNMVEQNTPKSSPEKKDSTAPESPDLMDSAPPTANLDKPKSNAEEKAAAVPPSDTKEVAAASDSAAPNGEPIPLGSILKGSPFEQDASKGEASNAGETSASAEPAQSSEQQAPGPSTPNINGESKDAPTQNAGLQSKAKTTPRPPPGGKKSAPQLVSSTRGKSEYKPQTSTPPAPSTPKNAATPSKQPIYKTSPKAVASKEPEKEAPRDKGKTTVERPSRPSVGPKAPAAAPKPPSKPAKKPPSRSPPSLTKPRPRSPTRPVRLPSSATAPTAASAAKLDAATAATAKSRDRVPPNSTSVRQKPARTSLPAVSKPAENPKDKLKSRLSTASSKPPEGSFLDRMMRPTQSTSQKTHEKVEAKTPPKKANGARPKRKSDASEKSKNENVETKGKQSMERAPSPPVQASANPSETPRVNGVNSGTEEPAPASDAPVPTE